MRVISLAVVATTIIVAIPARAYAEARLPERFLGVWMLKNDEKSNCTRQDWKGDTESDFTIYSFESHRISGHEYGCDLRSVRPHSDGSITAKFNCGGEGSNWTETQQLSLKTSDGKPLLVQKTTFGKISSNDTSYQPPKTEIYQQCR